MKKRGQEGAYYGYLWRTGYMGRGADKALPFTQRGEGLGIGTPGSRPQVAWLLLTAWLPWEKILAVWEGWVSGT